MDFSLGWRIWLQVNFWSKFFQKSYIFEVNIGVSLKVWVESWVVFWSKPSLDNCLRICGSMWYMHISICFSTRWCRKMGFKSLPHFSGVSKNLPRNVQRNHLPTYMYLVSSMIVIAWMYYPRPYFDRVPSASMWWIGKDNWIKWVDFFSLQECFWRCYAENYHKNAPYKCLKKCLHNNSSAISVPQSC